MMGFVHIFIKEVIDGLRDRRSSLIALLFMPIGIPLFLILIMNFALQLNISKAKDALAVYVVGSDRAPNLISFLQQQNFEIISIDLDQESLKNQVRSGKYNFAVLIPDSYAESFLNGHPANVRLIVDYSNNRAIKDVYRVRAALQQYSQKIAMLRMQLRGVPALLLSPLAVEEIDIATPGGRAFMLLLSIPYILFTLILAGGMHMANDLNAGERERGSLEPLLVLPVSRIAIVGGKCTATIAFMLLAMTISIVAFILSLRLLDMESIGFSSNTLNWSTGLDMGLVLIPFVLFGSVLFNLVASFARSYKETQTYLTIALAIPALPILLITLYSLELSKWLMFIPSLGQGLLIIALLKGKEIASEFVLISMFSTLVISALLFYLLLNRYKQEKMLI